MSLSNSVVNVNTDDLFRVYVDNFLFGFYIETENVFILATLLCMYWTTYMASETERPF